jgi:hypothetical protein
MTLNGIKSLAEKEAEGQKRSRDVDLFKLRLADQVNRYQRQEQTSRKAKARNVNLRTPPPVDPGQNRSKRRAAQTT